MPVAVREKGKVTLEAFFISFLDEHMSDEEMPSEDIYHNVTSEAFSSSVALDPLRPLSAYAKVARKIFSDDKLVVTGSTILRV